MSAICEKIEHPEEVELLDVTLIITVRISGTIAETWVNVEKSLSDIPTKKHDTVLVITECPLRGEVYRYGNHGQFWERIGKTCGYA